MSHFVFTVKATRDAHFAAKCAEHPPRRCPDHLIAPGTPEAACWTMQPVSTLDVGGLFLCGIYPGDATPVGATRERVRFNPDTGAIVNRLVIAEPTTRQLDDARAAKLARQPRELVVVAEVERVR